MDDARKDPALVAQVVETAASFAWTRGMLTAVSRLDRLAALPLELTETLPDGTRLLGVHASPGCDEGSGIRGEQTDAELAALLDGSNADLILTGHTHRYVDRELDGVRAVNLGSVSLPPPDEPRSASYVALDANEDSTVERRLVEYDHRAVVDAIERADPPGREFLLRFFV